MQARLHKPAQRWLFLAAWVVQETPEDDGSPLGPRMPAQGEGRCNNDPHRGGASLTPPRDLSLVRALRSVLIDDGAVARRTSPGVPWARGQPFLKLRGR